MHKEGDVHLSSGRVSEGSEVLDPRWRRSWNVHAPRYETVTYSTMTAILGKLLLAPCGPLEGHTGHASELCTRHDCIGPEPTVKSQELR